MFKKSNNKVMVSAIVIAIISSIFFLISAMVSTPEKTLMKYSKAMEKGDKNIIEKFLPYSEEYLSYTYFWNVNYIDKAKIIVDDVSYRDDKSMADVSYYFITYGYNGIKSYYNTISMTKRNGKWHLNNDL